MNKIVLENSDKFNEFYEDWDLTFCGCIESEWNLYIEFLNDYTRINPDAEVYYFKGKLMNRHYGLVGNNAYPDDLGFIVVKLSDIEDINKIALPMREVGGRWFTDIVDNNSRHETA